MEDVRELARAQSGQGAGEIAAHEEAELPAVHVWDTTVGGDGAGGVVEMQLWGGEPRIGEEVGRGKRCIRLEQRVVGSVAGICGIDVVRGAVAKPREFARGVEFLVGGHASSGQRRSVEQEAESAGAVEVLPETEVVVSRHR